MLLRSLVDLCTKLRCALFVCLFVYQTGDEQFQLITWAKDCCLRLWVLEPRMIMVGCGEKV